MNKKSVGFIGGGRIVKILLYGLENSSEKLGKITVFDPSDTNLLKLKRRFPDIEISSKDIEPVASCDIIFISVHPPIVLETLEKIQPFVNENSLIVSLAPKITIDKMKTILTNIKAIARVNPSAPGIIKQGMNPVAFSDEFGDENKKYMLNLLSIIGKTPVVQESKIETYALISAMGPTYFWFQLKILEELGIQYGMDKNEVQNVIYEMMVGSINTLFYSEISPEEVMDLVPVKPIGEYEETIKSFYTEKLNGIYNKIKP